ncbi:hypothetical protein EVAR_99569_1 [Eumeta japonica]|uniref:DH domain-containing protein n=1 Tax=Eumeta variegata TaxID=151549 RepID=A0A4C1YYD2_EUMVA|nr:hypothetical protein EVAR_99569_1 [Eumeta japonica]
MRGSLSNGLRLIKKTKQVYFTSPDPTLNFNQPKFQPTPYNGASPIGEVSPTLSLKRLNPIVAEGPLDPPNTRAGPAKTEKYLESINSRRRVGRFYGGSFGIYRRRKRGLIRQRHRVRCDGCPGSTTDLTPTLIGIYDSFLNPAKTSREVTSRFDLSPKDARNDPPPEPTPSEQKTKEKPSNDHKNNVDATEGTESRHPPKDPSKIAGSVRLPGLATMNKSSLYPLKNKLQSDKDCAEIVKCNLSSSDTSVLVTKKTSQLRTFKDKVPDVTHFDNLSPNVKRMISSASETNKSNGLIFQKKNVSLIRSSVRGNKLSNIPLVGATSKISQSGVEILPSVEIYDRPSAFKATKQPAGAANDPQTKNATVTEFKVEEEVTYDVPTNNRLAIYDVPNNNKTAFECLSLPYIDQSIEVSSSANDREFDVKLSSNDNSPDKSVKSASPEGTPSKIPKTMQTNGTNSLHRKDFVGKNESPIRINPYPDSTASTGNLKLCDKDRLQAPAMEVPRPLSMSSIASSSSTSSSGVQNKGGVNSAYLASIESLDDHSDADITSAAGSNNFVNDAGALSRSISEEKHTESIRDYNSELPGLSQLERVCAEIVQTENVYVDDLRQVVEVCAPTPIESRWLRHEIDTTLRSMTLEIPSVNECTPNLGHWKFTFGCRVTGGRPTEPPLTRRGPVTSSAQTCPTFEL